MSTVLQNLTLLQLNALVVTMCLAAAVVIGVGSAYCGRFRIFRTIFRYFGWGLAMITAGSVYFTAVAFTGSRFTEDAGWFLLLTLYVIAAIATELAMLTGVLMMLGGVRVDEETITVPKGTVLDRFLRYSFNDDPYITKKGISRSLCGLAWIVPFQLILVCVVLACAILVEVCSLFVTGNTLLHGDGGVNQQLKARRVLYFSPALVLLGASLPTVLVVSVMYYIYRLPEESLLIAAGAVGAASVILMVILYRHIGMTIKHAEGVVSKVGHAALATGRKERSSSSKSAIARGWSRFVLGWDGFCYEVERLVDLLYDLKETACPTITKGK